TRFATTIGAGRVSSGRRGPRSIGHVGGASVAARAVARQSAQKVWRQGVVIGLRKGVLQMGQRMWSSRWERYVRLRMSSDAAGSSVGCCCGGGVVVVPALFGAIVVAVESVVPEPGLVVACAMDVSMVL